jgi:hypothetical protein
VPGIEGQNTLEGAGLQWSVPVAEELGAEPVIVGRGARTASDQLVDDLVEASVHVEERRGIPRRSYNEQELLRPVS